MESKRYFFDQDQDSHWYMIPLEKKERWIEINQLDPDDELTWEAFEEFSQYMTGGGIDFSFENPESL